MAALRHRAGRAAVAVGVPLAVVLVLLAVGGVAAAAFQATASNPSSSWTGGTVTLSDNRGATSSSAASGTALWSVTGLIPGTTDSRCVRVTYGGSLPAGVRLFVAPGGLTGTLGTYLRLQVDEAATGSELDCSDFPTTGVTSLYNPGELDSTRTLAAFASAHTSWVTGVGTWAATTGAARTYRVTWTVLGDAAAKSQSAGVTLTWQARNS